MFSACSEVAILDNHSSSSIQLIAEGIRRKQVAAHTIDRGVGLRASVQQTLPKTTAGPLVKSLFLLSTLLTVCESNERVKVIETNSLVIRAQNLDPSAVKVTSVSFHVSQSVSLAGISLNDWNTVGSSAFIGSIATASNVSISAVHVDGLDVSDRRRLLSADVTPDGRQLLASGQFIVRFSINCTQPDQASNVAKSVTQVRNPLTLLITLLRSHLCTVLSVLPLFDDLIPARIV